jgi:predicted PurR-regulated permease PerM
MKTVSVYRVAAVLVIALVSYRIIYYGKVFLVPITFAVLLAMLMLPVSRKLEGWGMGRIWATLSCIGIILLFITGMFAIISAQAASMSEDLPQILTRLQQLIDMVQQWIQQQFGVPPEQQISFAKSQGAGFSKSLQTYAKALLTGSFGLLGGFALTLLYFFFLMWKREKYKEFFLRLAREENQGEVKRELHEITKVAGQYLIARLLSMLFLAVVYALGFSIIGLKNGILIALIAVIPTIIPYVGAFIGGFFPLVMALVSGSAAMALPVIGVLVVAQIIDNNIIEPLVEGSSLNLSPIVTILAIVLGELTWGVAGMILFIPLFAVIRIICEHIPALHPYGFLLANDVEEPKWIEKIKGWAQKLKAKAE